MLCWRVAGGPSLALLSCWKRIYLNFTHFVYSVSGRLMCKGLIVRDRHTEKEKREAFFDKTTLSLPAREPFFLHLPIGGWNCCPITSPPKKRLKSAGLEPETEQGNHSGFQNQLTIQNKTRWYKTRLLPLQSNVSTLKAQMRSNRSGTNTMSVESQRMMRGPAI